MSVCFEGIRQGNALCGMLGNGGTAPHIRNLDNRRPATLQPAPTEQEVRRVPERVWSLWRREELLTSSEIETRLICFPARSLLTVEAELDCDNWSKRRADHHRMPGTSVSDRTNTLL